LAVLFYLYPLKFKKMSAANLHPGRIYPTGYRLPRKNVLLISCMDLRLIDEIVGFMSHDNLNNRYDQFILAGASLGAGFKTLEADYDTAETSKFRNFEGWHEALFHHIDLAIKLHDIQDIYILEHRQCGAYKAFLKEKDFTDDQDEKAGHYKFAIQLSNDIKMHVNQEIRDLHVHCFLMDLRGNVELLHSSANEDGLIGLNESAYE
jgi:hypothetical protein